MLGNFSCLCCLPLTFFKMIFFKKFFREYHQSVKQCGLRSGLTCCQSWFGSKLFAKVISSRQVSARNVVCWLFLILTFSKKFFCKLYQSVVGFGKVISRQQVTASQEWAYTFQKRKHNVINQINWKALISEQWVLHVLFFCLIWFFTSTLPLSHCAPYVMVCILFPVKPVMHFQSTQIYVVGTQMNQFFLSNHNLCIDWELRNQLNFYTQNFGFTITLRLDFCMCTFHLQISFK